jgi:hypothetical protein
LCAAADADAKAVPADDDKTDGNDGADDKADGDDGGDNFTITCAAIVVTNAAMRL